MKISITNSIDDFRERSGFDSPQVLFTGDFCPDRGIAELIGQHDYDQIFNNFLPFSRGVDISITNLECPLTERSHSINKVGPVLKAPLTASEALKHGGFNVACLANNHIMDYGALGLKDTMEELRRKKIHYVGAGESADEAKKPLYLQVNNRRLAIINITEHEFSIASNDQSGAAPVDPLLNYYQITEASKQSDFLILIVHGGHEMYSLPSPRVQQLYRYYIDLGVDVVIGHHPHVFSGYEIYEGKPIFYSLGNFIFDRQSNNKKWHYGFSVILSIRNNTISDILMIPFSHSLNGPGVEVLNDGEVKKFKREIEHYNEVISDPVRTKEEFDGFVRGKREYYLSILMGLRKYQKKLLKRKLYPKFLIRKKRFINTLNLLRCQAHQEATIKVLENESIVE
jgi:poly-gamma-glutamate synthesis protein (capsule biosynthesis protein)